MQNICECCGAKMVEYKHNFNAHLAEGLYRLYCAKAPINLQDLNLTKSQWTNFQKLRYWGLVAKTENMPGVWQMTERGINFIELATAIPRHVWTYRGEPIRFEQDVCRFKDVHENKLKQKTEYAEESVAH